MSSDLVEEIHIRLREELERLGLKLADAARAIGEESSQGLRDVCSGRKRASAELVAKVVRIGADAEYVLLGSDRATSPDLPPDEQLLLDAYRGLSQAKKKKLLAALLTGDVGAAPVAGPSQKVKNGVGQQFNGPVGGVTSGDVVNERKP